MGALFLASFCADMHAASFLFRQKCSLYNLVIAVDPPLHHGAKLLLPLHSNAAFVCIGPLLTALSFSNSFF